MKNFKLKIGALLASGAILVAASCSKEFLDVPPVGQLAEAQLTSLAGIDGSLIAAYSQVNGRGNKLGSPSNWVWGSIRGGEANKGAYLSFNPTTINTIQRFENNATDGDIGAKYDVAYEGIARANNVLRLLTAVEATPVATSTPYRPNENVSLGKNRSCRTIKVFTGHTWKAYVVDEATNVFILCNPPSPYDQ